MPDAAKPSIGSIIPAETGLWGLAVGVAESHNEPKLARRKRTWNRTVRQE